MRVRFDEPAGFDLFMTILRDEFPVEKKAIAASLLCQCKTRDFIFGPPGHKEYTSALNFANLSSQYGLFTHAYLNLATICDAGGDNVDKVGPFSVYTHLWTAYHKYREDSGLQRRNARRCALCDKKPQRRSMLKKCAGDCVPDEKPVYCSKKCQRAIETVESDDEWTTDTDVADWVPSDEEEPPFDRELDDIIIYYYGPTLYMLSYLLLATFRLLLILLWPDVVTLNVVIVIPCLVGCARFRTSTEQLRITEKICVSVEAGESTLK